MTAMKRLAAAVAVSLVLGACATSSEGIKRPLDGPAGTGESGATVRVQNLNWSDVVVYAVRSGTRTRLGMVTSMSTQTFRLPRNLMYGGDNLRLLVDPVGSSQGYLSEGVIVRPGQQVAMNVQNHLSMTSVAVWNR